MVFNITGAVKCRAENDTGPSGQRLRESGSKRTVSLKMKNVDPDRGYEMSWRR